MPSQPSTSTSEIESTDEETSTPSIKVPKTREERHQLREGHVDDDNSDIAYMNFPLYAPNFLFTLVSGLLFIAAVAVSLRTDYIPRADELLNGFIVHYGASRFSCKSSTPFPVDGLPSILNLFEVNVIGNVLFRLSVGLPMAVRVFNTFTMRSILRVENEESNSPVFRIFNELLTPLMFIESVSMALYSIITVHSDFPGIPEWNRVFKMVFAVSSTVNMLLTTALVFSYSRKSEEKLDTVSVGVKVVTSAVYCYLAPQYFHHYHATVPFPICHSYVPRTFALMEYALTASYAAFHFTSLLDIRDAYLICFPRTCSGECEPLDPKNFAKGGKYEHCRSFEYNQRRLLNL